MSEHTLGSRGYFFLMDTDGSRRSRVNEAQSDKKKNPLEPRVEWARRISITAKFCYTFWYLLNI